MSEIKKKMSSIGFEEVSRTRWRMETEVKIRNSGKRTGIKKKRVQSFLHLSCFDHMLPTELDAHIVICTVACI